MAHYEPDIESWSYVHQSTGQRRLTHPALPRATLPPPPPVPAFGSIVSQVDPRRQQPANTQVSATSTDIVPHSKGKEVASKQEPSQSTSTKPAVLHLVEAGPSSLCRKEPDRASEQDDRCQQYSRKRSASPQDIPAKRICATNDSIARFPEAFRPRSPVKAAAFAEDTDDDLTDLGDDDEVKFSLPCRRCRGIHADFRAWGHNYAQCPSHTPAKQRRLLQELETYRSGLADGQQPHLKEEEDIEGPLRHSEHLDMPQTDSGNMYDRAITEHQPGLSDGQQPDNNRDEDAVQPILESIRETLASKMYDRWNPDHLPDLRNG
ncbi:hypothetical protein HII31_01120 [Pseudocercospora fuligena]|uniref:Uncharacterized protein n=1 Tax=Pseudocercospora fuligena TaxID=685502 RepID=A0A8H6RVE5_9PEZI|nr:hypothetical protein HII31_01120 [Pseudocercospora fuligena]